MLLNHERRRRWPRTTGRRWLAAGTAVLAGATAMVALNGPVNASFAAAGRTGGLLADGGPQHGDHDGDGREQPHDTPAPQTAQSGVLTPQGEVQVQPGGSSAAVAAGALGKTEAKPRASTGEPGSVSAEDVADVSPGLGGPLPGPDDNPGPVRAEDRLSIFRNTTVPVSADVTGAVSEPSTDQSGRNIFATGNYHAEFSRDGGANWTGIDPYTAFGPGFCCDQATVYDPGRNRQHWVLQYVPRLSGGEGYDHLTLANSAGGDFLTWCLFNITPNTFGRPADESFDYNDLVVGTRYLYLTSRLIRPTAGTYELLPVSMMLRVSLDDLKSCRPARYDVVFRTDLQTLRVAQGSTDVAYAASTGVFGREGNTLRMLVWPEKSNVVTAVDQRVPRYRHVKEGTGEPRFNCASADGVVNNWCAYTDSGVLGAARGNGYLWFSWSAEQYGDQRPFPYTRLTRIRESDLTLAGSRDLYSRNVAHILATLAPDRRGHVGLIDNFGGGTGATHYFPGGMVGLLDDISPRTPTVDYFLRGQGGGCTFSETSNTEGSWGDYNTIRGWHTGDGVWNATTYVRNDDQPIRCGNVTSVTIKNVTFGRERDRANHDRWANS